MLCAIRSPEGDHLGYHTFAAPPETLEVGPTKDRFVPVLGHQPPDFDPLTQVLEGPVITHDPDVEQWTWTVRPFGPGELAALRVAKAAEVKGEAGARILNLFPDWKQRNMTARGVELVAIRLDRDWTPAEAAESADLQAAWAQIRAIRAASGLIEAAIPQDAAGIAAFDIHAGWG